MSALLTMSVGSAIAALFSAGVSAAEPNWQRFDTFDQHLSFEVPCNSQEMEIRENGGSAFGARESEARCDKEGVAFRVQVFEVLAPTEGEPFFDQISAELYPDPATGGKPTSLAISGHRAVFDSGEVDGLLGQRGLVELNSAKVALIMAGGVPGSGASLDSQRDMISRFFSSLRVHG